MYYIQKYADCWAVRDSVTGGSRPLTSEEVERLKNEFSCLKDEKVETIAIESIKSIRNSREQFHQLHALMGAG